MSTASSNADVKQPAAKESGAEQIDGAVGLDDEVNTPIKLTIETIETGQFSVLLSNRYHITQVSELVKTILEQDPSSTNVPLPSIKSRYILERIAEYVNHFKGNDRELKIRKPVVSVNMRENIANEDKWAADFIDGVYNRSVRSLYDLIQAANYMDMKVLLSLCCAKVASLIKGKSPADISAILNPKKSTGSEDQKKHIGATRM